MPVINGNNAVFEKDGLTIKIMLLIWILFFISGIVVGALIGGKVIENRWQEYNTEMEIEINKSCICYGNMLENADFRWDYDKKTKL